MKTACYLAASLLFAIDGSAAPAPDAGEVHQSDRSGGMVVESTTETSVWPATTVTHVTSKFSVGVGMAGPGEASQQETGS